MIVYATIVCNRSFITPALQAEVMTFVAGPRARRRLEDGDTHDNDTDVGMDMGTFVSRIKVRQQT